MKVYCTFNMSLPIYNDVIHILGSGSGVVIGSKVPTFCVMSKDLDYLKTIVTSIYIPEDKIVITEEFKKASRVRIQDIMKSTAEIVCMKVSAYH